MGAVFRAGLSAIKSPLLSVVRGKGLMTAIIITPTGGKTAWDLCLKMRDNGLLAKPTHDDIIRLAPPLVINEEQIQEAVHIVKKSMAELLA